MYGAMSSSCDVQQGVAWDLDSAVLVLESWSHQSPSNLLKVTWLASIFSFVKWVVVIIREDNVI